LIVRYSANEQFEIYDCTILFHGKRIGTATAGIRKDAKKLACRMAADYLRDNRRTMRRVSSAARDLSRMVLTHIFLKECVCRRETPKTSVKNVVITRLPEHQPL
jgi:hypothetical protein